MDEEARELRKHLGERIRAARRKHGLKTIELAARVGVAPATVSGWEHGRYEPSLENLRRIVEVTGEPSSYFNPERLAKRGSIEWLARDLGARLGRARLRKLLEMPENRLRREIDAILGRQVIEEEEKRSSRKM